MEETLSFYNWFMDSGPEKIRPDHRAESHGGLSASCVCGLRKLGIIGGEVCASGRLATNWRIHLSRDRETGFVNPLHPVAGPAIKLQPEGTAGANAEEFLSGQRCSVSEQWRPGW